VWPILFYKGFLESGKITTALSGITLVSGIPAFLYAIDTSGRYSLVLEILRDSAAAADAMVHLILQVPYLCYRV
jgi:hypothetical protein